MLEAVLAAAVLLAVGLVLRVKVKLIRVLYLPASVVAGIIAFTLVQVITGWEWVKDPVRIIETASPIKAWFLSNWETTQDATTSIAAVWRDWPGPLIAVVFAALLLEREGEGGFKAAIRRGTRSGILAWIIILGQLVIGAVVCLVAVDPSAGVPGTFSQLLESSWAGGHGTSAGMAEIFARGGWPEGKDLAFFLATIGLIYGVLSGLVLVNLAIRRGWTAKRPDKVKRGDAPSDESINKLAEKVRDTNFAEAIGPMTLQAVILGCAFFVGFAMHWGVIELAEVVFGEGDPKKKGDAIDAVGNLPLFLFTLLGGGVVRYAMARLNIAHLIDVPSLRGMVGAAMDFLIVAAVASMKMEALTTYFVPIVMLVVLAGAWSTFCLLVLSPRLLPRDYWFELGLLNYGFSTANTPQGFMLLRIIDPDLSSRAAEDYAVAAPLSAPFVGGGIITFVVFPVMFNWSIPLTAAICAAGIVVFYLLGRKLARSST